MNEADLRSMVADVRDGRLPLVQRGSVAAFGHGLHAPRSAWDVNMANLADWWKDV